MDYLNSLDLDSKNRRSHRVRSWYLYEQYKSLERNQLDAAKKLKDKSYQEKILQQELLERKARRKLYAQFGSWQSEPGKQDSIKSDDKATLSASADDFFESFCELRGDENVINVTEHSSDDSFSQDDSVILKSYIEDFKSVDDREGSNSKAGSVRSVIENIKSIGNPDTTLMGSVITNDLNSQLEEAKENIACIEKLIELNDIGKTSENDSENSTVEYLTKQNHIENRKSRNQINNVLAIWSRLVSFAYQIIKINHGNCYYDYSSQFLTAVLACDVLRRGISNMCNILQPYVSPIKFVTDDESDMSTEQYKKVKRKIKHAKKIRKHFACKNNPSHKADIIRKHNQANKYWSEDCWPQKSRGSLEKLYKKKWLSEPWRSTHFITNKDDSSEHSSCGSIWPEFSKENILQAFDSYECCCCKRFRNPMLKIAQYIDSILKDLGDCY